MYGIGVMGSSGGERSTMFKNSLTRIRYLRSPLLLVGFVLGLALTACTRSIESAATPNACRPVASRTARSSIFRRRRAG